MKNIKSTLAGMGIALPALAKPLGSYRQYVKTGDLIFVSGQGPFIDGEAVYCGKVGEECSLKDAYKAAELCAIHCLAVLDEAAGLENIGRIVNLRGYVNSGGEFSAQPAVINGATDLLIRLFGDDGCPSRCAVSVNALPENISVEIEMVAEIKHA